jgi:CheY-like chemotaxis protein
MRKRLILTQDRRRGADQGDARGEVGPGGPAVATGTSLGRGCHPVQREVEMTILFLSDVPLHRERIEPLIRGRHTIVVGRDGVEGQALARAVRPDLLVIDRTLPVLDRWDYARILSNDPQLFDVPIIALVVHGNERDRARALASGCREYLERPVSTDELLAHFERLEAA